MGKLNLTARHRRAVAATAAIVAVVMAGDVAYQLYKHVVWRHWIASNAPAFATTQPATQPASQPAETQPSGSQPASAPAKSASAPPKKPPKPVEIVAALKKRNLFVAPKPAGHGLSLTGVLGRMAMFRSRDGKTVSIEEGQAASGVKVTSINGYEVTIEFEGKPETMKLHAGGAPPPAASPAVMRVESTSAGGGSAMGSPAMMGAPGPGEIRIKSPPGQGPKARTAK